jgi:MFS family permease
MVARWAPNEKLVLAGLGGIGIGALMLGTLPFVSASVVATLSIGLTFSAIIIPAQTLLQQETPPPMMGRVSSSVGSVVLTAQVLGLVLSGVLAELTGIRAVFIGCAVLAAALAAAGRLFLHVGRSVAA